MKLTALFLTALITLFSVKAEASWMKNILRDSYEYGRFTTVLDSQVDNFEIDRMIEDLTKAHKKLPKEERLIIKLNSPGGSVFAGFKLMNHVKALQRVGRKVDGVVTGICASMCFAILQTLDQRLAYPHAMLMQHMPSGGNSDVLEELERHVEKMEAERIGIDVVIWRLMVKANVWWMSDYCLKFNVIDDIVVENLDNE